MKEIIVHHDLTGSCQCGDKRYRVEVENHDGFYCHCRMCQKAFGNIFATFITVDKNALTWLGEEPDYYRSSPIARRGFCARCGTPLTFEYEDSATLDLSVGALDEADEIIPRTHFGWESHLPHWHVEDGLPHERADEYPKLQERWKKAHSQE